MAVPVLGLSGWSGSGKTTLLEKILPRLCEKGLRIAVVKHDVHGICEDGTGKDSDRLLCAGAVQCVLCSPDPAFPHTLSEGLAQIKDADLVLVEGFKHAHIPRLAVVRKATGKGYTDSPETFLAVVSDDRPERLPCPYFSLEDPAGVTQFILQQFFPLLLQEERT